MSSDIIEKDANQDFSHLSKREVKHSDSDVIRTREDKFEIKNIEKDVSTEMTNDEIIDNAAARILQLYRPAFEELAR